MKKRLRTKRALKMYRISVTNTVTHETATLLGQSHHWSDAVKDALANHADCSQTLAVTLPNGETVVRHENDFESELPHPAVDATFAEDS